MELAVVIDVLSAIFFFVLGRINPRHNRGYAAAAAFMLSGANITAFALWGIAWVLS